MQRRSFLGSALVALCAPLFTLRGLKRPELKRPRTFTWVGRVSHDWSNPRNWEPCGVPSKGDAFRIPGGWDSDSYFDITSHPAWRN